MKAAKPKQRIRQNPSFPAPAPDGTRCVRLVLPHLSDFRAFWKQQGPFGYALTSLEYPPVLLAPEEWIFGFSARQVLAELIQGPKAKIAFVRSDPHGGHTASLVPDHVIPWRIRPFPEAWHDVATDFFLPSGQLTRAVADRAAAAAGSREDEAGQISAAFFQLLEEALPAMGYVLFKPEGTSDHAVFHDYLKEWAKDEADAGLL